MLNWLVLAGRATVRPRAKQVNNFVARESLAECDFALVIDLSIGLVSAVAWQ